MNLSLLVFDDDMQFVMLLYTLCYFLIMNYLLWRSYFDEFDVYDKLDFGEESINEIT